MIAFMVGWESTKIYYVLAFYQVPIDSDFYLYLPADLHVDVEDKNETYLLKSKKNLYGTLQVEANWFDIWKTGLQDEGFKQNKLDPYFM